MCCCLTGPSVFVSVCTRHSLVCSSCNKIYGPNNKIYGIPRDLRKERSAQCVRLGAVETHGTFSTAAGALEDRGSGQNETKSYVSDDPDSIVSNRWHRYAVDDTQAAYWWWNPVHHNICFREDDPREWRKYSDPATDKTYWYLSNEIWFWENTGNTMC